MMRAVGERRERGTRSKSNVTEDNLLLAFETRLQQIDQGQIETVLSLAARPFWQLALVVGNSVDPSDPDPACHQQIQTLLTNFLISAPALGPAVGQVATCRGVAPASSAAEGK